MFETDTPENQPEPPPQAPAFTNEIPVSAHLSPDHQVMSAWWIARNDRMRWLHNYVDSMKMTVWPALLTVATTPRTTVGPYGDTNLDLGYFLDIAKKLQVETMYASYLTEPRHGQEEQTEKAMLGDGLVLQFLGRGVLHTWAGAPLPGGTADETPDQHPDAVQQAVIDRLATELVAMAGYRALTRQGERQSFARTELAEIGDIERGQHPVLPQNFAYRVLRAANDAAGHAARTAYANIDMERWTAELADDHDYGALSDKTARRHHIRQVLFEHYDHAASPQLVAALLNVTDHIRPNRR